MVLFNLAGTAQAHIPKWHGPHTPGYMIINLEQRKAHDLDMLQQPIGDGWLAFVPDILHKDDLKLVDAGLKHYHNMLGNVSNWVCIHHYEGSWSDPNNPFWGGLQMDVGFQLTYGSDMIRAYRGFANKWNPLDQMIVAQRAFKSRGYYPWPNTARYCGLI